LTLDSDHLLRERLGALADRVDDSDWPDVRRRAGTGRRSRLLALAAATIVVVAIAAPALALSGKVVHVFGSSEPAPERVQEDFASLDVGAPRGMAPDVIAEQTRMVIDTPTRDGTRTVLWVAPTRAGGFCITASVGKVGGPPAHGGGGGGGCDRDRALPFAPGIFARGPMTPDGVLQRGPLVYDGSVLIEEARAVRFDFQDGDHATVPLVWVSEPIDAGFFVYAAPQEHWVEGHRVISATVEDGDGKELATQRLPWIGPARTDR
jgi:hypothetical protein